MWVVKGLAVPEDVEPYIPVLAGRFEGREDIPSWVASAFVGTQGCFVSIRKVKSGEMWNQIDQKGASHLKHQPRVSKIQHKNFKRVFLKRC